MLSADVLNLDLYTSLGLAAAEPPFDTPLGQCLLIGALFVVGSLFGSFANVVVYRLPAGKSLLWPASHCPRCGHTIRWHDNVPVFGWLLLNGKCRDCGSPISPRYPLVEVLFGLLLATLGWLEYIEGGVNLPEQLIAGGGSTLPLSLWLQVAYHMLLVSTLLVAGLIEWDRKPIPSTLWVFALACGLIPPLLWSALRPDSLPAEWPGGISPAAGMRAALEGAAGVAASWLLALLAWPTFAQASVNRGGSVRPRGDVLASIVVGAFLGWQAACGVAVLAVTFDLTAALASRIWPSLRPVGYCLCLTLATSIWLISWSTIARATPTWTFHPLDPLLAAAGVVAVLALLARSARKKVSDTAAGV